MKINSKKQKGFTLTPALFILVLMMIAGTTYLIYINTSGRSVRKIEKSQIAKFAAETGIYQIKSQLAKLTTIDSGTQKVTNNWYNAKAFNGSSNNYIFTSAAGDSVANETSRSSSNTARISNYIDLKDGANKKIAQYRITLEDGGFFSGLKTVSGSATEGTDRYGNQIWSDDAIDKNYHKDIGVFRYGIRVDGFSIDASGNKDKSSQSIYAVIDVPKNSNTNIFTNWGPGVPAGYLLSTDGYEADPVNPANDRYLTLISGQVITGKIHSNNRLDFQWNGNFDIFNPDRSSINDKYTVSAGRWSGAADPSPILIGDVVREPSDTLNQLTIYGTNFSLNPANIQIKINGSAVFNPSSVIEGHDPPPANTPVGFGTKLKINIPGGQQSSYDITITSLDRSQTISYKINDNKIPTLSAPNPNPIPLKIYGIMQVNAQRGFTSQHIYKGTDDYRLIGPPVYPTFNAPYIAWDPSGAEPAASSFYETTYITEKNIPHNKIKVFDNITYSGTSPKLFYIHSHKAQGTSSFPWTANHSHEEIFGMSGIDLAEAIKPDDYYVNGIGYVDWSGYHRHIINSTLITYNPGVAPYLNQKDLFFTWRNDLLPDLSLRPTNAGSKFAPIESPNNLNYFKQRLYADQIFRIILNRGLSKTGTNLNALSELNDDRANGYYDLNNGMIDFGSVYFGNDLKYTIGTSSGSYVLPQGSPITDTATIYVNENKSSSDYLKVAGSDKASDPNYKYYTYRQIPKNAPMLSTDGKTTADGGIIFVRNGVVRIGGAGYKGNVSSTAYTKTPIFGNNTIIDGRLTIVSYTESKPSTYVDNNLSSTTDNQGDIVITGNVIYKNKIYPEETEVASPNYSYSGFQQFSRTTGNAITEASGSPVSPLPYLDSGDPTKGTEKVNSLALIASNDIKIPVSHYYHPANLEDHYTTPSEEASSNCPCKDTLRIYAQLIAGHKITQTKIDDKIRSQNDRLILHGAFYSFLPPNLSYFDRTDPENRNEVGLGRMYLYDKTLYQFQLAGTPSFPKFGTYTSEDYPVVGSSLPKIVPGTWKVVSDGAQ